MDFEDMERLADEARDDWHWRIRAREAVPRLVDRVKGLTAAIVRVQARLGNICSCRDEAFTSGGPCIHCMLMQELEKGV